MKPVCLVIGAGAGIGGNVGKRFARGGYHAVLCRRSDEDGLRTLVESIEAEGGAASGVLLNAADPDSIELYQPDETLTILGEAISSLELTVDQTTFDTLTFRRGDSPVLDEIRFSATYDSVVGASPSPTLETTVREFNWIVYE